MHTCTVCGVAVRIAVDGTVHRLCKHVDAPVAAHVRAAVKANGGVAPKAR